MKLRRLFVSLSVFTVLSASTLSYSQSAEEKKVLDEINLARSNPQTYVKKVLEPLVDGTLGQYQSAVIECISQLRTMKPLPELQWSSGLYKSAAECVSQKSKDGSEAADLNYSSRISKYISWTSCGEMVAFGHGDARSIVLSLLLDIPLADRPHRRAVFSDKFTHLGAAIGTHSVYENSCALDFASGCISFDRLPGIVYHEDYARQIVSEINIARTKPLEYISTRLEVLGAGSGKFGDEVKSLISYLKKMDSVNALVFNEKLCESARTFVNGTKVSEGVKVYQTKTWERNIRKGRNWGTVAQAFVVGETDPRAAVLRMLLDASSKNRTNLLSPDVNYAGAFVGANSLVCVDLGNWYDSENTTMEGLLEMDAASAMIEEINWARTKPAEYSKARLEPLVKKDGSVFQKALAELIKELSSMKSVPALKTVEALNKAASEWTSSAGKNISTSYDANWQKRIAKYGIMKGGSEALYFGDDTPEMAVASMLIDEALLKRGRRRALLSASNRYVGASTAVHGIHKGMALVELAGFFVPNEESALVSPKSSIDESVTVAEIDVINEINLARTNPKEYVRTRLHELVSTEKNTFQTALGELITEMNLMQPVKEVGFSKGLHDAADEFVRTAGKKGSKESESAWLERVDRAVQWKKAGEIISVGCYDAKAIVLQLLIDDGIASRAHRNILLNGELTEAGAAIGQNSRYGIMCVIDLIKGHL